MKKICILGNSHVGSLKRAWDELKQSSVGKDFEITFFAERGDLLKSLTANNKMLVTDNMRVKQSLEFTSGGFSHVNTNEYDIFLIYGSQLLPFWLYDDAFYSLEFIERSIQEHLEGSQAEHLLTELRKATNKEIFLGHDPMLTQKSSCAQYTVNNYNVGMEKLNSYLAKNYNAKAIKQSEITLENKNICKTDIAYLKNSRRLAIGFNNDNEIHPKDDLQHMNDDFGSIWISNFFEKLYL
ncbi:hypothetical protein [Vreelandella titanicae]|uniref:Uncharacterized protein n=1 Tax=Vreelandella titanicae TaxID=664683 RepID=A0A558JDD2_9GAMM|nr:hypothetical protein [Halomonas titanicae]TVU91625.1 hypothetical protein FQP89_00385 [Halomonas titanicae]